MSKNLKKIIKTDEILAAVARLKDPLDHRISARRLFNVIGRINLANPVGGLGYNTSTVPSR